MGSAVCALCTTPFVRRVSDLKRSRVVYCSVECRLEALRGRAFTDLECANPACSKPFRRLTSQVRRARFCCCSRACVAACTDYSTKGRLGGSAPHRLPSLEARAARSRRGGIFRALMLSPARLREIAKLGVAARLALPQTKRREIGRRGAETRTGTRRWFGVNVAQRKANG